MVTELPHEFVLRTPVVDRGTIGTHDVLNEVLLAFGRGRQAQYLGHRVPRYTLLRLQTAELKDPCE